MLELSYSPNFLNSKMVRNASELTQLDKKLAADC